MMRSSLLLIAFAACGGGAPKTTQPQPAAVAPYSQASIDAFHEALAPLWHSPESADRTEKTCAAIPSLELRAQDIGDARLVETLHELDAECSGGRKDFQARFSAVHDAFHGAMEKGGAAHHEEH